VLNLGFNPKKNKEKKEKKEIKNKNNTNNNNINNNNNTHNKHNNNNNTAAMYLLALATAASLLATLTEAFIDREAYTVIIDHGEKTCYSKSFTQSVKVIFEYHVTVGGNKDIDARVVSPNGLVIYKELKKSGDEVSFMASEGDFKFCFSNEFSTISYKRIAFNIRPFEATALSEESGEVGIPMVKGPLEAFCDDIHLLTTAISDYQMKYRVRESMGRYLAEQLSHHVMWWSLGQALIIMMTGFGQVMIFKRFFTDKRYNNKPVKQVVPTN